jgi:hypothetical protein
MENIFGGLLEFPTTEDFEKFIDSIDKESSVKILELSILYAQQNGLYNLSESHCLYKCLKKLKE